MREYDEAANVECAADAPDDGAADAFERPRGGEGAAEDDVDPDEDDDRTAARACPLRDPLGFNICSSRGEGTEERPRCATIAARCNC
jgi:hypothetical protein